MFDDEQEFKITPITKVTSVGNQLFDNCLSQSMYEFKAMYKNAEGTVGQITITIPGRLNPKWEQIINNACKNNEMIIPRVFRNNSFSVGKALLE